MQAREPKAAHCRDHQHGRIPGETCLERMLLNREAIVLCHACEKALLLTAIFIATLRNTLSKAAEDSPDVTN